MKKSGFFWWIMKLMLSKTRFFQLQKTFLMFFTTFAMTNERSARQCRAAADYSNSSSQHTNRRNLLQPPLPPLSVRLSWEGGSTLWHFRFLRRVLDRLQLWRAFFSPTSFSWLLPSSFWRWQPLDGPLRWSSATALSGTTV